jgi:hypothetical protein
MLHKILQKPTCELQMNCFTFTWRDPGAFLRTPHYLALGGVWPALEDFKKLFQYAANDLNIIPKGDVQDAAARCTNDWNWSVTTISCTRRPLPQDHQPFREEREERYSEICSEHAAGPLHFGCIDLLCGRPRHSLHHSDWSCRPSWRAASLRTTGPPNGLTCSICEMVYISRGESDVSLRPEQADSTLSSTSTSAGDFALFIELSVSGYVGETLKSQRYAPAVTG